MSIQAILAAIAELGSNIAAIASAYRLAVLTVAGGLISIAGLWGFIYRPQSLIVVVLASILSYAYMPRFIAWVRGKA